MFSLRYFTPHQSESGKLSVESDIADLQLDPLEGVLYWASPRGHAQPYQVHVRMQDAAYNWTLRVAPSYRVQLDAAADSLQQQQQQFDARSNARLVQGRVLWEAGAPALNGSVPLTVHVARAAGGAPIEDIPIWSEPLQDAGGQQRFRHSLYPYLGLADADKIAIVRV